MRPSNKDISQLLKSVAAAYLLTNVNRFRIIAYQKAADAVDNLTQELFDIWENNKLEDLEGVGPQIRQHLDEYFQNPKDSYLLKQRALIPETVYALMQAPGIGPKKAYKIVTHFKLHNVGSLFEDVNHIASKNEIAQLEGFGEKSQKEIVDALEILQKRSGIEDRMSLPVAFSLAQQIMSYIKVSPFVEKVEALGSLRRMVSSIGDIDLAVISDDKHTKSVIEHFVSYPHKISIESQGEEKAAIITSGGRRVDLRVISKKRYGSMLQYFTGSKAHNIKLREYALKKGFSLNEFGITPVSSQSEIKGRFNKDTKSFNSEEKFYEFLGLQWIPPEIREGADEVKLAQKHKVPNLVSLEDIKGEFHIHSSFNIEPSHDLGADTFEIMIQKAKSLKYAYLGFSEHNPSQSGHTLEQIVTLIKNKKESLQKVSKKNSFTCFNSLEVDILPDGSLAIPDESISYLDLMIISIHSSFRMNKEDMTKRILKGLSHPKVKVLAHPTGRLLSKREEINADWDKIFAYTKEKNIALEINSWPERLDLPDTMAKTAIKNGNKLILGTDAHAVSQMDNMFYGVAVARRAWAKKSDIINTKSVNEIKKWIEN